MDGERERKRGKEREKERDDTKKNITEDYISTRQFMRGNVLS